MTKVVKFAGGYVVGYVIGRVIGYVVDNYVLPHLRGELDRRF